MSLFITGTDTGVGKTLSSAALLLRYSALVPSLRYWKPVQTGEEQDTESVRLLTGLDSSRFLPVGWHFSRPLSPHRAAELEGRSLERGELVREFRSRLEEGPLLVEGAGGVAVPLNRSLTWLDLLGELSLPSVVVARTGLGTINHTLLTVEALLRRRLPVAGILFAGEENEDNQRTLEEFTGLPLLGRLFYEPGRPLEVAGVDPRQVLRSHLVS